MNRILILGSGGAGKSTFAARLARAIGLPLVHLDSLYWQPGWVETPKAEWKRKVEELIAGDRWIMDGNYGGTLDQRIAACDTVIFLDMPRRLCLWRVLKRRIRFHGRSRPDMREGCPEKVDWEFLKWVWGYSSKNRGKIVERLAALRPGQQAVILKSTRELEEWYSRSVGSDRAR